MAYRFTTASSSRVQFAIAPFNGYTFGPATIAALVKLTSTSGFNSFVFFSNSSGGANKFEFMRLSGTTGLQLAENAHHQAAGLAMDTTSWWIVAVTYSATGATPRFHWNNGSGWSHFNASSGSVLSASVIGGTDQLFVSAPGPWGGEYMAGDVVCAGVKKSDSSDATIETLSLTSFPAWTGYGFEWLAGFEASGTIVNRSNPGTGDETSRTSVSLVSDPPGWVWAPVVGPVADFTGTPLTGTASLSVAFTDTSTNTPTSWAWNFGDGTTSTSQNPTHSYTTSGVFTVTLVATNATGSDTKTRTGYITVGETIIYAAGGGIDIY